MDLININTAVVIEYCREFQLYPTHEVVLSEDYLPLEGLLQSCAEFVLAVPNSALTIKKKISGVEIFVENFEDQSSLTISYFDMSEFSFPAKEEILKEIPTAWRSSKKAIESFPQILGDGELPEDSSLIPGFTEVKMELDQKVWVELEKPIPLTTFLKNLIYTLDSTQQLLFKIPTYPLIEIQDLDKITYRQMWLVREK